MCPDVDLILDRPVFVSILIDSSGSMEPYAGAVIDAHRVMLDVLRKSQTCHKGASPPA
jgi:hypothetical protein